jgi:hypothetical protein
MSQVLLDLPSHTTQRDATYEMGLCFGGIGATRPLWRGFRLLQFILTSFFLNSSSAEDLITIRLHPFPLPPGVPRKRIYALGFSHGSSHGSSPKRVTVRGDHRKGQEATAGHKPLDGLAPAVVWCGPVLLGVELPNASHKPRVGRSIRPTATKPRLRVPVAHQAKPLFMIAAG